MLFIFISIFTRTGENRTDHTASSLLASSFRIASGMCFFLFILRSLSLCFEQASYAILWDQM